MTKPGDRAGAFLSLGRLDCAEFQPLWEALQDQSKTSDWRMATTVAEFLDQQRTGAAGTPIEFAVIWQSWSDEYPAHEITALLGALPLCRVVCVTGPWCEADGRTRRVWPPALVVPWWRAGRRLRREFEAIHQGAASTLPWTASREEVWLDEHSTSSPRLSGLVVALDIPDSAFREMLKFALVSVGATVAESQLEAADFVLVDVDVPSEARIAAIRALSQETGSVNVLGLTAWSTLELSQAASEWGVTDVIPKLDMLTLFERMANGRGDPCRSLASP